MTVSKPGILKKWLILAVFVLALLSLAVCWFPFFVEKTVLPRILAKNGLAGYQVAVHSLGIHGCSLHLIDRPDNFPFISSGNLRISWTVKGLLQRRLNSLVFDGLHVHHYLSGVEDSSMQSALPEASVQMQDRAAKSHEASHLPVVIDTITVSDSIFFLHDNGRIHSLPFSINGQVSDGQLSHEGNIIKYTIEAGIGGQGYVAEISYRPDQGVVAGVLTGDVNLPAFMKTLDVQDSEESISGRADLFAQSKVRLSPFSLEKLQVTVRSKDFQLHNKRIALGVDPGGEGVVSLSGSQRRFQIDGNGISVDRPFKSKISFNADAVFSEKKTMRWQGDILVEPVSGQKFEQKFLLAKAPAITLQHEGILKGRDADIKVFASHQNTGPEDGFEVNHDTLRFRAEQFELESHCTWQPDNKENQIRASVLFEGKNLIFNGPGMQSGLSAFRFDGTGNLVSISAWEEFDFNGGLTVEHGFIGLDQHEVHVEGIHFELPVPFPWKDNGTEGEFRAEQISMRQLDLGKVRGELVPKTSALEFTGRVDTPLLSNNSLHVKGAFRVPDNRRPYTKFSCSTAGAQVDLVDFLSIFPALKNVTGSGLVDMQADMVFHQENVEGQLGLALHKWGVEVPKYKMAGQDINMQLHFPDVSTLRSSPEQKLSIGRVTNRNLSIENIQAVFQVESLNSLFVEKIGGKWSGGRVFTSAFRLSNDKLELDVALFCDRLELPQVLSQLSLADAEGSGKVSGRIPVSYRKNEIFIDDGFLFSTPGEKGNLKIKKSKQLTAGIPEDVPQYSPIHFAGAALRDFEYNWAKLLLVSEEDNLVLKLQIDGKPANPLPYRFDSQQNVFIRINDAQSGGIDQPIKLDVNFNVPLNELLRYQSTILPILRNIK